nr:hypothetical protein [Arthrospira sp. SH-MAG29]
MTVTSLDNQNKSPIQFTFRWAGNGRWLSLLFLGGYLTLTSPLAQAQQQRYGVYVSGDNPLLVEIVQQVQPGAIIKRYGDRIVIDAGIYFNQTQVQQLVSSLRQRGVQAQITDFRNTPEFQNSINVSPLVVPPQRGSTPPIQTNIRLNTIRPTTDLGLYQVYIRPGAASLDQVRQVSPNAQIVQYQGVPVIQAGSFVNLSNAEQLLSQLILRRIRGEVVASRGQLEILLGLPTQTPTPRTTASGINLGLSDTDGYFVLIPTPAAELSRTAENAIALGVPQNSIIIRDHFADPLVAVGPFADLGLAQEWENYLTDSGIGSAQIYFGR